MTLTKSFGRDIDGVTADQAYRVARDWLVSVGAKDLREDRPRSIHAIFGKAISVGWQRKARKILTLEFVPSTKGAAVRFTIGLSKYHADEARTWEPKIVASWTSFADELWQRYGVPLTQAEKKKEVGYERIQLSPGKRAVWVVVGAAMILGAVIVAYLEGGPLKSFLGSILEGALFLGGLVATLGGARGWIQSKVKDGAR